MPCERGIVDAPDRASPERILEALERVAADDGLAKRINVRTGKPVIARKCAAENCPEDLHWFGAQSRTITREEALGRLTAEKRALR